MLTNAPHVFYNKKNKKRIRLTVKYRAWYAVATLKDGGDQMELDVVQQGVSPKKPPAAAQAKSRPEKPEAKPKARSASQKPETSKPNKATKAQRAEEQRDLESVKSLEYTPFKFVLRSLRTPVCVPSSGLKGSVCEACAFEEDAASEARDGSMMKAAVPCEVAPRGHQEVAWWLAVLCLGMVGMLAFCVRVARSVCACKVSGLSFPGGFLPRLQGVCNSLRGRGESERLQGTTAAGSESHGRTDHATKGVLTDHATKGVLTYHATQGVYTQDDSKGSRWGCFRYGKRLGHMACSVYCIPEKGSGEKVCGNSERCESCWESLGDLSSKCESYWERIGDLSSKCQGCWESIGDLRSPVRYGFDFFASAFGQAAAATTGKVPLRFRSACCGYACQGEWISQQLCWSKEAWGGRNAARSGNCFRGAERGRGAKSRLCRCTWGP